MRKTIRKLFVDLISFIILSILIISAVSAESQSAAAITDECYDPIQILGCSTGNEKYITIKNNTNWKIRYLGLRVKYYDKDDSFIIVDENETLTSVGKSSNRSLLELCYDELLKPDETAVLNCSDNIPFCIADHVEIAFSYFKDVDGYINCVPESDLYWYSSQKSGYIKSRDVACEYQYPDWKVFSKAKSFALGFDTLGIYPEYLDHYHFTNTGSYIYNIKDDSLIRKFGVKNGDILETCDGISIMEDSYIIERSKAKIADGESVRMVLSRDGEEYSILVSPALIYFFSKE